MLEISDIRLKSIRTGIHTLSAEDSTQVEASVPVGCIIFWEAR